MTKKMMAVGRIETGICPTCKKFSRIVKTKIAGGWERWECVSNGCVNEYRNQTSQQLARKRTIKKRETWGL